MPNNKHIKLVFTNGCFDLLHYGHVYFLEEAQKLLKETPVTYGDMCAPYFVKLIDEVKSGKIA